MTCELRVEDKSENDVEISEIGNIANPHLW